MGDGASRLDAPLAVCVVELTDPDASADSGSANGSLVIPTIHGAAVGAVMVDRSAAARPETWRAEVQARHGAEIAAHLAADGMDPAGVAVPVPVEQCPRRLRIARHHDEPITVVVATRDRPQLLARCLDAVLANVHPLVEVVVVDNAPTDDATRRLIEDRYVERVHYVLEPTPGLARAHNAGRSAVTTPLVAFTDDDVVVDRWWLSELVGAFGDDERVGAVTGLIVPDELDTSVQVLLERHGAYSKGFTTRTYDLRDHRPADPFFPFAAGQMGSGANMAFRTDALDAVGGFDEHLGIGTRARGGDDLAALTSVVARGWRVVYEPAAMARHRHHRDQAALARQAFGYGVGLGAHLTAAALRHPRLALAMARHGRSGLRLAFSPRSERDRARFQGWPSSLVWRERAGLLVGPLAYTASRLEARARRPGTGR